MFVLHARSENVRRVSTEVLDESEVSPRAKRPIGEQS